MRALRYALRQGWYSLWRTRGATAVAVLAIALALVVLGTLLLVTWNTSRLLARLSAAAELSVYLRDDATSEQRGAIEAALERSGLTAGHEYVSRSAALARFRSQFTDLAALADSFDDNPFPASLEVRLRGRAGGDDEAVAGLVRTVSGMPGVADVRYDREWLARLGGALRTVSVAGLALALVMGLAAAVTVAAVVRLGLQARDQEIEIMELVGAPLSFIRGPFVAEGLLQGGLGALVALLVLWGGFAVTRGWWGGAITGALGGGQIEFLPVRLAVLLVVGGMVVGAGGGFVAARHAGVTRTAGR